MDPILVKQDHYLWCWFLQIKDDDGEHNNKEDEVTDEGSKGEEDVEDIEHGDVADSPVGLMEPSAAQKQGHYFTEADDKDEAAMCHNPDCNSTVIINKDILCCDSLGCYQFLN